MMFQTVRIGNTEVSFKDGVIASFRFVYKSLLANYGTPARAHYPRKTRKPKLFKGHRP